MMRSLIRWCRRVLPPEHYIAGALLLFLVMIGMVGWEDSAFPWTIRFPLDNKAAKFLLVALAAAYGIFRILAFHPASRPEYLSWLKMTPWRPGIPLPIGPLHLILQDAVTVGLLAAASLLFEKGSPLLIFQVFLISYFLPQQLLLALCNAPQHAYWMTVILGGVFLFWNHPLLQLVCFAILYGIALQGERVSLKRMADWDAPFLEKQFQLGLSNDVASFPSPKWGWPHDNLSPQRAKSIPSRRTSIGISFLAGWWMFVILACMPRQAWEVLFPELAGLWLVAGLMLAGFRLYRYFSGCRPPISLMGRLMTFRWIIPGFDVVFVGPLVIVGTGALTFSLVSVGFVPILLAFPVMITLQLLTFFRFPPGLDQWRLTGNLRTVPPIISKSKELQITQ